MGARMLVLRETIETQINDERKTGQKRNKNKRKPGNILKTQPNQKKKLKGFSFGGIILPRTRLTNLLQLCKRTSGKKFVFPSDILAAMRTTCICPSCIAGKGFQVNSGQVNKQQ
jgi:hypothetical protein